LPTEPGSGVLFLSITELKVDESQLLYKRRLLDRMTIQVPEVSLTIVLPLTKSKSRSAVTDGLRIETTLGLYICDKTQSLRPGPSVRGKKV
jgi:hypothetical protein